MTYSLLVMTAVPFVGKDVPSHRSEFSHPDVVISLTLLGYRYVLKPLYTCDLSYPYLDTKAYAEKISVL